ncbi:MAG: SDR family oxidoreductase [Candidatus Eisenbacteria bacterium]|nr:SDR family oxidoreductase [Candidatus Eisenbacteria bacterium]
MAKDTERFCDVLCSQPVPSIGTILVTGATGYVGGRLAPELQARGYRVRVFVRAAVTGEEERWRGAEVAVGDAADRATLNDAMRGVHTAYYLMHSMLLGSRDLEAREAVNARNFRQAAEENGVQRIIYLGGLGDVRTSLSSHLRSRMMVATELQSSVKVATTVLRAAIIIGSGSASYEIIHHLVKRLPVILLPQWTRTRCQPIGIRDVVRYLVGTLEVSETAGGSFDIGGTDVLTYEAMMRTLADILGKRRLFLRPLFSSVRFYAYFTGLLTPVPAPIVRSLMEGLRNDVVCEDNRIRTILPFTPLSYREAIEKAMAREEQDAVHTRWSNSYPPAHAFAVKLHELKQTPRYSTNYSLLTGKKDFALFRSICRIGGKEGWFYVNWMWRLRGVLDSLLMGVGTARGRRSSSTLRVNDVIDFWRVEALTPHRRLLLRAEMKLPGRAWLEFRIDPEGEKNRLSVQAYYDTRTLFGHIYWYTFHPFHWYIFERLLVQIEKRS